MKKTVKTIETLITWSGEGIDVGKRLLIIRFKTCNRRCVWCDTQVRMRSSIETEITFEEIQKTINIEKCGIMLTGGCPTFGKNLQSSIDIINEIDCNLYNVETNGYALPELISKVRKDKNVKYIYSPKLFSEEDYKFYIDLTNKIKDEEKVYIKLVCEDRPMVIEFLDYLQKIEFPNDRLWLMPEGVTSEEILAHAPFVFDMAEKYKANFSSREHIIYGFV